MVQRSFRLFEDQIHALRQICALKYRGRRNPSDLLRDYLDSCIDSEGNFKNGQC